MDFSTSAIDNSQSIAYDFVNRPGVIAFTFSSMHRMTLTKSQNSQTLPFSLSFT